jgi:phosphate transport system substrate-binding protein
MGKSDLKIAVTALLLFLALSLTPTMLSAQTLINGAGATFPYPIYSKWFSEYRKVHSDVQINYQSIGSGGGIKQVTEGTVDFGASDGPMTDQQLQELPLKMLRTES